MNPKGHLPSWLSSVAQVSKHHHNLSSSHLPAQPSCVLPWPVLCVVRPFPFVFSIFLQLLPVYPQPPHLQTCTRSFTLWPGPNFESRLPESFPPHSCNKPYPLFSPRNPPCTPSSRKTELSPLSSQFPQKGHGLTAFLFPAGQHGEMRNHKGGSKQTALQHPHGPVPRFGVTHLPPLQSTGSNSVQFALMVIALSLRK